MSKSSYARHQAKLRVKRYQRELKALYSHSMLEFVGFGRNFKKDPWDCGVPNCWVCHHEPSGKSNPKKIKKESIELQEALNAVRQYQKDWQELGVNRVYKHYDDVDGDWLDEF